MKINIGDYLIESDSMQFIVKEKKIVQEGENKGKEYWVNAAYCCKFDEALRFIPNEVLKSNDDINIITSKLNQIHEGIKAITYMPTIEIKANNGGANDESTRTNE